MSSHPQLATLFCNLVLWRPVQHTCTCAAAGSTQAALTVAPKQSFEHRIDPGLVLPPEAQMPKNQVGWCAQSQARADEFGADILVEQ